MNTPSDFERRLARHRRLPAPWRILSARPRLVVACALGALAGVATPDDWRVVTRALVGWDVAVCVYLVAAIVTILRTPVAAIRYRAQMLDDGRHVLQVLTSLAAAVAIGAIVAELAPVKTLAPAERGWHLALAAFTIVASWTFIHFEFALHYAHEFYLERAETRAEAHPRGGLIFPETPLPIYSDFIYFAFIIGVAAQTADVSIASRPMRAIALGHSILTFFFNTTILALTINIVAGLF